jgi:hypothetical protein
MPSRVLSHLVGKLLGTEMVFGVPTCMLITSFVWRQSVAKTENDDR